MPLDATPGSPTANSYLTLVEADEYFETRLHTTAWDALGDSQKEAALIMATRELDARVEWTGSSTTEEQALAWPREGMARKTGGSVPDDEIPKEVKYATAELALTLVGSDVFAVTVAEMQNLKRFKAGPVEMEFKEGANATSLLRTLPSIALSHIPPSWYTIADDLSEAIFEVV